VLDISVAVDIAQWRGAVDRLDHLAEGKLRKAIEAAVERAAEPLPKRARATASARLPKRGGLAEVVARTDMPIVTRMTGARSGVLIPARPGVVKDPAAINRGRVRHPVFGHWTKPPLIQHVRPGWFTDPMVAGRPEVRAAIEAAIREVLASSSGG
jgi:hypothetical protein